MILFLWYVLLFEIQGLKGKILQEKGYQIMGKVISLSDIANYLSNKNNQILYFHL